MGEFYHVGENEVQFLRRVIQEASTYFEEIENFWSEMQDIFGSMADTISIVSSMPSPIAMMRDMNGDLQMVYDVLSWLSDLVHDPRQVLDMVDYNVITEFASQLQARYSRNIYSSSKFVGIITGQQVTTWNATTININTFSEGCSRLLAADVVDENFIVLVKGEKIIIVLPSSTFVMDLNTLAITNAEMEGGPRPYLVADQVLCTQTPQQISCQTPHVNAVLERTDFGSVTLHLTVNTDSVEFVGGLHGTYSSELKSIPEMSTIDDMEEISTVAEFKNQYLLSQGVQC